jgi:FKBP-type peptidyl-prolyl cis-trans isomerase 2
MSKVENNSKVKVHYTGKLESGEQFDSSQGREPLAFTVGAGQMIPGFEKAVIGMELNESKTVNIPSAEAYGERNEKLIQQVPKSALPPDIQPYVGQQLVSQAENGQQIPVTITAVETETITVDANHQLAGKNLVFDIEVVEIA